MKLLYINHTFGASVVMHEQFNQNRKYVGDMPEHVINAYKSLTDGKINLDIQTAFDMERANTMLTSIYKVRNELTELKNAMDLSTQQFDTEERAVIHKTYQEIADLTSSQIAAVTFGTGEFERYRELHDVYLCNVIDKDNLSYTAEVWVPKLIKSEANDRSLGWYYTVQDNTLLEPTPIDLSKVRSTFRLGHLVRHHHEVLKRHEVSISLFESTLVE